MATVLSGPQDITLTYHKACMQAWPIFMELKTTAEEHDLCVNLDRIVMRIGMFGMEEVWKKYISDYETGSVQMQIAIKFNGNHSDNMMENYIFSPIFSYKGKMIMPKYADGFLEKLDKAGCGTDLWAYVIQAVVTQKTNTPKVGKLPKTNPWYSYWLTCIHES